MQDAHILKTYLSLKRDMATLRSADALMMYLPHLVCLGAIQISLTWLDQDAMGKQGVNLHSLMTKLSHLKPVKLVFQCIWKCHMHVYQVRFSCFTDIQSILNPLDTLSEVSPWIASNEYFFLSNNTIYCMFHHGCDTPIEVYYQQPNMVTTVLYS